VKKIPTMFERDWNGDRSRVTPQVHAGCEWVLAGEGIATHKLDGTCCMIRDGKLYKRREISKGGNMPPLFEREDYDDETGKTVGWVPVGDGPEDQWYREGLENCRVLLKSVYDDDAKEPIDGTFELVGPKVQGNPEKYPHHLLVRHGSIIFIDQPPHTKPPRTFDGLRDWLSAMDIEGIVFHHPDGRMAKIKARDFGLKRRPA
jgi:hypothetical protein